MPEFDVSPIVHHLEFASRLEFLQKAVEDTQETIRFLDTKAAFCVTLLSAMVAGVLEPSHTHEAHTHAHEFLLPLFIAIVGLSLVINLRVIFPVIKPPSTPPRHTARPLPKFFVGQHRAHHWLRHTFSSNVANVLSEDFASYISAFEAATDPDLLHAMCDEVLMVSLIRQIKADRLRLAMYSLAAAIVVFCATMMS
jgi:hypothetical protein